MVTRVQLCDNITDILTKPLTYTNFYHLQSYLGLHNQSLPNPAYAM